MALRTLRFQTTVWAISCPFLQQTHSDGQQRRSEEYANDAKRCRAAQDAEQNENERHTAALPDDHRLDHVVDAADQHAPRDHENAPSGSHLKKEPQGGRYPDEGGPNRSYGKEE